MMIQYFNKIRQRFLFPLLFYSGNVFKVDSKFGQVSYCNMVDKWVLVMDNTTTIQ